MENHQSLNSHIFSEDKKSEDSIYQDKKGIYYDSEEDEFQNWNSRNSAFQNSQQVNGGDQQQQYLSIQNDGQAHATQVENNDNSRDNQSFTRKQGQDERYQVKVAGEIEIYLTYGNILDQQVDAIVNAANESLSHGAGLAYELCQKAGPVVQEQCDQFVRNNGKVTPGNIFVSNPGRLPCKKVFHAVGPTYEPNHHVRCRKTIKQLTARAIKFANAHQFTSIAFPPISTGIFGVPKELTAKAIFDTIDSYAKTQDFTYLHLNIIKVVIKDDETYQIFEQEFISRYKMDKQKKNINKLKEENKQSASQLDQFENLLRENDSDSLISQQIKQEISNKSSQDQPLIKEKSQVEIERNSSNIIQRQSQEEYKKQMQEMRDKIMDSRLANISARMPAGGLNLSNIKSVRDNNVRQNQTERDILNLLDQSELIDPSRNNFNDGFNFLESDIIDKSDGIRHRGSNQNQGQNRNHMPSVLRDHIIQEEQKRNESFLGIIDEEEVKMQSQILQSLKNQNNILYDKEGEVVCEKCGYKCEDRLVMKFHEKETCPNANGFCHLCGQEFPKSLLSDHAEVCLMKLKKCKKCDQMFNQEEMVDHMTGHEFEQLEVEVQRIMAEEEKQQQQQQQILQEQQNARIQGNVQNLHPQFVGPNNGMEDIFAKMQRRGRFPNREQPFSIDQIPVQPYKSNLKSQADEDNNCIVCQHDFKDNEMIIRFKCLHIFHQRCGTDWLNQNLKNFKPPTCPICNTDQSKN
eukprot:403359420